MQDDKFCNISTRDFNFCWKKRVKHKVQAIAHLPMNEKTARASENAQAHAEGQEGREAITGKGDFSIRGASAAGRELQHCQDTHEIPQVPRAAEKHGMLFPWHMDNLLSCWHLLKIHGVTALFLRASSIKDVSPHVWNHGHTRYHLSRESPISKSGRVISHHK